ncbi:MAG: STAS domain-containing protein [Candidatus Latescibacterota bacterium]|jgi:ABC-type transporter Mla MlaB component
MLRIDLVSASEAEVVLKVGGALAEQGVGVLGEAVQAQWRPNQRLVLDLAEVDFVDPAGLALLQTWSDQGLELRGASLYVRFLLQTRGPNQGGPARGYRSLTDHLSKEQTR